MSASLAVIYDFASTIVRSGGNAMLIGADNEKIRWIPIGTAATTGIAFAVEVAPDILALDADSPELGERAEAFAACVAGMGLGPVVVASGRPGHRHVFARVPDPIVLRELKGLAVADEHMTGGTRLDVRCAIRPPLAPHRLGLEPSLVRPSSIEEALVALGGR